MSDAVRVEKDSMGEMPVPADALYGASTARAIQNFPVSGLRLPPTIIRALLNIKLAAGETNGELREIDPDRARAIVNACSALLQNQDETQFPVDVFQTGSGTSTNMNVNEVIATRASQESPTVRPAPHDTIHPTDHVNRGQSSNDVFPSAIHIAAAEAIARGLVPSVMALLESLEHASQRFSQIQKSGRTHLQDAVPLTLGQEFSGFAAQLTKGTKLLEHALDALYELPIGGTAVGTGANAHGEFAPKVVKRLSKIYGLHFRVAENHFESQAARDTCVEVSGVLKTLAVSLSKIANDIRWMASSDLNELTLPTVQPGSSIMPGKVNPVMCESLLQVCAQVIGNDTTITLGGLGGNFQLNTMQPLIGYNLLQSIQILTNGIRLFDEKCVRGLMANEDVIADHLSKNLMLVTLLAPKIGYDKAAEIAKRAKAEGKSIEQVMAEMGLSH